MISYKRIYSGSSAELIAHRKTRIITIILMAFAGLFFGFGTTAGSSGSIRPSWTGIFIYFASLIPLFSLCIAVFKDMHDIPTADVQMSMPLSSAERYISRLLTICRLWLIPFLISAAAAILISLGINSVGNTAAEDRFSPGSFLSDELRMLLWFMAMALFLAAVTIICQCCIGSKAESRYLPVLLMTVLSIFGISNYSFIIDRFADVELYSDYDCPALLNIWTFSSIFTAGFNVRDTLLMCLNCLISLGVIFGGLFICKRRDARTVGKPIVFDFFFEIIMFITLELLFLLSYANGGSMITMFLAWLGSIILRIVVARKSFSPWKKIIKWTLIFAGYYIMFMLVMYIAFATGGFGKLYRTPDISDLKKYSWIDADIYNNRYTDGEYVEKRILGCRIYDISCSQQNLAEMEKLFDTVSDSARSMSKTFTAFDRIMKGSSWGLYRNDFYCCRIRVYSSDGSPEDSRYSYEDFYDAEFWLDGESAANLANAVNGMSFDGAHKENENDYE